MLFLKNYSFSTNIRNFDIWYAKKAFAHKTSRIIRITSFFIWNMVRLKKHFYIWHFWQNYENLWSFPGNPCSTWAHWTWVGIMYGWAKRLYAPDWPLKIGVEFSVIDRQRATEKQNSGITSNWWSHHHT